LRSGRAKKGRGEKAESGLIPTPGDTHGARLKKSRGGHGVKVHGPSNWNGFRRTGGGGSAQKFRGEKSGIEKKESFKWKNTTEEVGEGHA